MLRAQLLLHVRPYATRLLFIFVALLFTCCILSIIMQLKGGYVMVNSGSDVVSLREVR